MRHLDRLGHLLDAPGVVHRGAPGSCSISLSSLDLGRLLGHLLPSRLHLASKHPFCLGGHAPLSRAPALGPDRFRYLHRSLKRPDLSSLPGLANRSAFQTSKARPYPRKIEPSQRQFFRPSLVIFPSRPHRRHLLRRRHSPGSHPPLPRGRRVG